MDNNNIYKQNIEKYKKKLEPSFFSILIVDIIQLFSTFLLLFILYFLSNKIYNYIENNYMNFKPNYIIGNLIDLNNSYNRLQSKSISLIFIEDNVKIYDNKMTLYETNIFIDNIYKKCPIIISTLNNNILLNSNKIISKDCIKEKDSLVKKINNKYPEIIDFYIYNLNK